MKTLINIIIVFTAILYVDGPLTAQDGGQDNFTVQVDGLGCPFCAYGLEKKFKDFESIDDVEIEIETGKFTFSYPAHDGLTMEQVEKQVEAAGYTAVDVKVLRANGAEEHLDIIGTAEVSEDAEIVSSDLYVHGNCGMCKARIEKVARSMDGVTKAKWNKKTKMLSVEYDKSQVDENMIAEKVAASGHDNALAKTDAETYESLPGCCQYDREQ